MRSFSNNYICLSKRPFASQTRFFFSLFPGLMRNGRWLRWALFKTILKFPCYLQICLLLIFKYLPFFKTWIIKRNTSISLVFSFDWIFIFIFDSFLYIWVSYCKWCLLEMLGIFFFISKIIVLRWNDTVRFNFDKKVEK